jgi:GH15 family glucan-1,4-alpha-glucosidase
MDQASGHLTRAFGESGLDAALLLLPMLGVRLDETILHKTVDAVQATLRAGDFVYRYKAEDGLSDQEGAFLVCSFWLVDALLALHRPEQAKDLFERLLGYANDVGLYPEEIDPATGEFLGNFPQAFTHLALINSAAVLDLYEKHGATAISGCHADRARRAIGKTDGLRGILHAARPSGRLLRLWSSTRSVLALD